MLRRSIHEQYFGFRPVAGHMPDCPLYGTDMWEVTRNRAEPLGGGQAEITIRMICRKCGVVQSETGTGEASESTSTEKIGYGSRPSRSFGLWLHPGPAFAYLDDRGPESYFVTGSPTPPATESEVIGIISCYQTRRDATRWRGGYGYRTGGGVEQAEEGLSSRNKAVHWVADRHAEAQQSAAAGAAQ